jgi:hypothetical protein
MDFKEQAIRALGSKLAAMPNYFSLLGKCRNRYSKYDKTGGVQEYNIFVSEYKNETPVGINVFNDPCEAALSRTDIKYIQNNRAKKQVLSVMNELFNDYQKLGGKSETLVNYMAKTSSIVPTAMGAGPQSISHITSFNQDDTENPTEEGRKHNFKKKLIASSRPGYSFQSSGAGLTNLSPSKRHEGKVGSAPYQGANFKLSGAGKYAWSGKLRTLANSIRKSKPLLKRSTQHYIQNGSELEIFELINQSKVTLTQLERAYRNGQINSKRYQHLVDFLMNYKKLGAKLHLDDGQKRGGSTRDWEINKDKGHSLFDLISNRYLNHYQNLSP